MITKETYKAAKQLFLTPGVTVRDVSLSLGISWNTANKLSKRIERPLCGCGLQVTHSGICVDRGKRVGPSVKANNYLGTSIVVETESKLDSDDDDDGSDGKCCEISCIFPAVEKHRCRQHLVDYELGYSMTASTLGFEYLAFTPDKYKRAL